MAPTRGNVVSACMEKGACMETYPPGGMSILNSSCMGIQYQAEDTNMCWRNLYSYYAFDDLIAYGFLEKGAGFTLGVSALFLRHNIHNFYKWFLEISHLGVCIASWLRSSLWLQFKPHHIAAGAAFLAAKFLNFDLASYQTMWQEFQTTPTILQGEQNSSL
ncbi:hypothetical protein ACLOJK_026035 [Asimina triloba]